MAVERIISADDHMDISAWPSTLFERVPAAMRERVPRVVDSPEGSFWQAGDKRLAATTENRGVRPGIPAQRLEDMDRDGIHASVIYGPTRMQNIPDVEARNACYAAYNDWADEFCAHDRKRLLVLAMVPGTSPEVAERELQRVAKMGAKGALLGVWEANVPVFDPPWNRFWSIANEIGMPIHFHVAAGLHSLGPYSVGWTWRKVAAACVTPAQLDEFIPGMVFSGILARNPRLRIVLGEAGLGWLPYAVARMDHQYRRKRSAVRDLDALTELPSDYFRRHFYVTYEEDPAAQHVLQTLDFENVMWASDYPHSDSTWPDSRAAIEKSHLGKCDAGLRKKILWDNASRLYAIE